MYGINYLVKNFIYTQVSEVKLCSVVFTITYSNKL